MNTVKKIRIAFDDELLTAVDEAANESQQTRSAFIRAAVRAELKRRQNAASEAEHRRSYQTEPDDDAWQPAQRAWGE